MCTQVWTGPSQPATQPRPPHLAGHSLLPGRHTQRPLKTHREKFAGRGALPCPPPTTHPLPQASGQTHSQTPLVSTPAQPGKPLLLHAPPPGRETAPWPRASPFTSGLKLGQQGGPPPLRLDDGARRQVRGVVPGVVLVLQQADVLQPEDRVSGCPLHSRRRGEGSPAQGPPTSSPGPEASGKRHVQR